MFFLLSLLFSIISAILSASTSTNSNNVAKLFVSRTDKWEDACMVLQLTSDITVKYSEKPVTGYLNGIHFQNTTERTIGNCTNNENNMTIKWAAINNESESWTLNFTAMNISTTHYNLKNLNLQIRPDNISFPGWNNNDLWNLTSPGIETNFPINNYYYCNKTLSLIFSNANVTVTFKISKLCLEAFRSKSSTTLFTGLGQDCPIDLLENNIIPLIVGGVLAGMIVIVIITYLIGRHKHKSKYQNI